MLSKANVLVLDDPTNHLDLESITALNDGLMAFTGSLLLPLMTINLFKRSQIELSPFQIKVLLIVQRLPMMSS